MQAPPVYRLANAPIATPGNGLAKSSEKMVQAKQRPTNHPLPPQPYRPANLSIAQQRTDGTVQSGREFLEQRQPPPVYRPLNVPAAQPKNSIHEARPNAAPVPRPVPAAKTVPPCANGVRPVSLLRPRTIQRSAKDRLEEFNESRKAIYQSMDFDYGTAEMVNDTKQYGGQASLDEIAAAAFSSLGSASTGAVAYMKDGKLLFASQTGNAATAMKAVSGVGTCVAADGKIPNNNMHAEMIIIYYCLTNAINPGDIQAIGVKDKGCCRLCSAMLQKLGISFTRTENSKYEIQWVNPYVSAGKASPIDIGSGISAEERRLI